MGTPTAYPARDYEHLFKLLIIGDSGKQNPKQIRPTNFVVRVFLH